MADSTMPMRLCDSCGQVDDHPRHVFVTAVGDSPTSPAVAEKAMIAVEGNQELRQEILRQIMQTDTTVKHMDCCAADGCPDGSCNLVRLGAEDLKGAKLRKHLTSGKITHVGDMINEGHDADAIRATLVRGR